MQPGSVPVLEIHPGQLFRKSKKWKFNNESDNTIVNESPFRGWEVGLSVWELERSGFDFSWPDKLFGEPF